MNEPAPQIPYDVLLSAEQMARLAARRAGAAATCLPHTLALAEFRFGYETASKL